MNRSRSGRPCPCKYGQDDLIFGQLGLSLRGMEWYGKKAPAGHVSCYQCLRMSVGGLCARERRRLSEIGREVEKGAGQ